MNASTTEPFRRDLAANDETRMRAETEFEKPRGINRIEIRKGFVTVHVSQLSSDTLAQERLIVLSAMADANISIDFLKLTHGGLSFVTPESLRERTMKALDQKDIQYDIKEDRCIVLTYAANMRDEEGLIAKVVSEVIGTGVEIDHLGDMHDRVLLVMDAKEADRVAKRIEERLIEQ